MWWHRGAGSMSRVLQWRFPLTTFPALICFMPQLVGGCSHPCGWRRAERVTWDHVSGVSVVAVCCMLQLYSNRTGADACDQQQHGTAQAHTRSHTTQGGSPVLQMGIYYSAPTPCSLHPKATTQVQRVEQRRCACRSPCSCPGLCCVHASSIKKQTCVVSIKPKPLQ